MSTLDPGLGDTVKTASKDLKHATDDVEDDAGKPGPEAGEVQEEEEEEEEEDYREPSHWWFASTAFPLLAGTFGPMANGFSICALANYWRVYIPPGGTEEHGVEIKDPAWLIAINVLSLACAITGNMTLLLNMARRVKFSIAQPITIIGFLLAGLLLIVDMVALTASPTYWLTGNDAPGANHALTEAFYYAIFAAMIYIIIGSLLCFTAYGAVKGHYEKDFKLTNSQRTLMLQTMMFIAYILLGALVFSRIENWNFTVAVYWADVTLLTVGLGDYTPSTDLGRGLVIPFALGGILMVGLVVGSIRSLVLDRGKEKLGARITEKRRHHAIHNVDGRKQTIRISYFAKVDFSTDPSLSPAQRREEEFKVMRKVQDAAERERRNMALLTSLSFGLLLWFVGAAIFMVAERNQQWTYFDSVYFTYICLLTIGYGDFRPDSNAGRAFFVLWSLLAVPSLTILISNMGDTIVKWFSDLTILIGEITVLPGENGFRAGAKAVLGNLTSWAQESFQRFSPPGIFGDVGKGHTMQHEKRMDASKHDAETLDRVAERLNVHIEEDDLHHTARTEAQAHGDVMEKDVQFYHYVLSRECRNLQKDLSAAPPKKYSWEEWEYYLKLMGNEDDAKRYPGQKHPDVLVPEALRMAPSHESDNTITPGGGMVDGDGTMEDERKTSPPGDATTHDDESAAGNAQTDGVVGRKTELAEWRSKHNANKRLTPHPDRKKRGQPRQLTTMDLQDWSWLSSQSPLMGNKLEAEWILERLSAALERELNRQRKGYKRTPPIRLSEVRLRSLQQMKEHKDGVQEDEKQRNGVQSRHQAGKGMHKTEDEGMRAAANSG
ncbi:hypothetical protein LTR91_011426 [Friedmanniomyces endolithicus]|uniref:Potassium channel domain-containing protein n=1 Tax=Friedmanniomyces endolithicus TaxID=329885 RepID=A0AAN6QRS8_9PEZI|nr:hypothetical protein LTR57_009949 [Friedmanniomyces endolithicus]KAK0982883.1 hypothetical protein LTR91_011426 [Friedmanniomyces endolithicus]